MNDEIKVCVIEDPGRRYFQMRYVDPITGKPVKRSTKKDRRRDAEKVAAVRHPLGPPGKTD